MTGARVGSIPALQSQLGRGLFQLLVLGVLLGVLLTVRSFRRAGARRTATLVGFGALLVAFVATLALTLRPVGDGQGVLHLDPVRGAWGWDSIAWNPVIDNVALFVPLGALAVAVWWRRPAWLIWGVVVALSLAIETVQFLLPLGRVANVADLLANAVGALTGVLLARLIGVHRPAHERARRASGPGQDRGPRPGG